MVPAQRYDVRVLLFGFLDECLVAQATAWEDDDSHESLYAYYLYTVIGVFVV